jgi:hypothetical protein
VEVTLDPIGLVNESGIVTLTGTIACSRDAAGTIESNLQQPQTSGHGIDDVACGHDPTAWTLKVRAFDAHAPFEPGNASADVIAFVSSAGYTASDVFNSVIDLEAS